LGWAVERTIESEAGRRVDRRAQWLRSRGAEPVAGYAGKEDAWGYSLATDVPEHWIPLLPVRVRGSHEMVLQRARMPAGTPASGEVSTVGARGDILRPSKPLFICEEEVPRGGVRVVRHFQYARGADGRAHLWVGRLKSPGRGEQKSRLRYDHLDTKGRGERS
jgi:1-acyl-sn-glycerol-3-phosphate acyltransferase